MKNFDICCLLLGILIFSLACQFYVVESFVGEQGSAVGVRPQQAQRQEQRQEQRQANRQAQQQAQRQEHRQAQRQANRQAQRQGQAPRQIQPPPQRSGQGQAPRQIQPPLQRSGPGQPQKSTTAFNPEQKKQIKKMVNDPFIQGMMKHQHKQLHQDMKRIKRENTVS